MNLRFGTPSFFLTVTPDEISSPLCLRLSMRDNSLTLPDIQLLSAEQRAQITSKNPAGAALFFQRVLEVTLKHLLGIDISSASKTTVPLSARTKGVLSYIIAYYLIIECQGRGTLHAHMELWGSIPPFLLQKCVDYDILVESVRAVIDSMYTAEISAHGYVAMSSRIAAYKSGLTNRYYPSLYESPYPNDPEYEDRCAAVATAVQIHYHTFTCHKGRSGRLSCRMCMPCAIREEPTGPTQIVTSVYSKKGQSDQIRPSLLSHVLPLYVSAEVVENYPLYYPDNRMIVWELKRPLIGSDTSYMYHRKNRWVVAYSKPLSAVSGTNTAVYHMGSAVQAKSTMRYVMDYLVKDATACTNLLSVIFEARQVTAKYKSRAEDLETSERKATHFLTRVINNMSKKPKFPLPWQLRASSECHRRCRLTNSDTVLLNLQLSL